MGDYDDDVCVVITSQSQYFVEDFARLVDILPFGIAFAGDDNVSAGPSQFLNRLNCPFQIRKTEEN